MSTDVEECHIVNPFRVKNFRAFAQAAGDAGFYEVFHRNAAGYAYCSDPRRSGSIRPPLEALYELLKVHLPPREYALVRIDHHVEDDDGTPRYSDAHVRYEKVYSDRVEPTVYSDDTRR